MESHHASMGRNDRDRDRDRGRAALARRRSAAKRIDSFLAKLEDGSSAHADSCRPTWLIASSPTSDSRKRHGTTSNS